MAVPDRYKEDAARIERDYIKPESTDEDDIKADLEDADFAGDSIGDILSWMADSDDVTGELGDPHTDGVTTREDVQNAVDSVGRNYQAEGRADNLTDAVSGKIGAPSQGELQRAQFGAIASGETTTPNEALGRSDAGKQSVTLVENTQGEVVGTVGGGKGGREVADSLGARHYTNPQEFNDSMTVTPTPDGRAGILRADGEPIGEVDL